jgi:predicted short-subunit dehydrogenase-like oxidoreductase (DUF2520 family)
MIATKLKLTIIGCGRLGRTLAFLWKKADLVCIQDVYNAHFTSAKNAVAFIGEGSACRAMTQFKPADIYLIATPDDKIEILCQQLFEQAAPHAGSLVFHCSGLHTSDSLDAVRSLGCHTASLHPLFSFSTPASDIHNFAGTYCSFEGNTQALDRLSTLVKEIGGQLLLVEKEHKGLYHVASVFASNYLVTLSVIAENCYKKAGLPPKLAKTLVCGLMQQSLNGVKDPANVKNALTGPLQRGDKSTLQKHISVLQPFSDSKHVYKSLGKATIQLTKHTPGLKKMLQALFS